MDHSVELEADTKKPSDQMANTPTWINKEYFSEFLKENVENFKHLETFKVLADSKSGENYASNLLRIKMEVILDDDSHKNLAYILKLPLPSGESETIDIMWSLFPKEIAMYREILPRFESLYKDQGLNITFGPKYFELPKTLDSIPENAILLEDLTLQGFSIENRLECLNLDYTEKVLKKLAEFHAVSVRYAELYGPYEDMFEEHIYSEHTRTLYKNAKVDYFTDYVKEYKGHEEYIELIPNLLDNFLDLSIAASTTKPDEFNVLNHGDFWINNFMFQKSQNKNILETYFIDFQLCKYGSPALDLHMFLLTCPKLDIKLKYFDYFLKIYHDHLVKHLKILKYSGKIISLKELHIEMLKYGYIGFITVFNFLPLCLCEPKTDDECNMDFLMTDSPEAESYRRSIFLNDPYKSHAEPMLVWMARRGFLE